MELTHAGERAINAGPADYFTGTVHVEPLFDRPEPSRLVGASVTFEPGARTAWHSHPLGQTLIVTSGRGYHQCEGGPIDEIAAGDVILCPANTRHWHGATATTAMTHIALQEKLDGTVVTWMEKVTDEHYATARPRETPH